MKKHKQEKLQLTNPLDSMLGYHLRRASGAMLTRLCRDYSTLGLSLTEVSVLLLINSNSGVRQSDIGRALDIKSANMTPLIATLDNRGYVYREQLDGRSHGLHLSKDGKRVVKKALSFIETNEKWLQGELSKLEKSVLLNHLQTIWR